jgi:hypothetical protein
MKGVMGAYLGPFLQEWVCTNHTYSESYTLLKNTILTKEMPNLYEEGNSWISYLWCLLPGL